jgi:hypothetical protein
MKQLTSDEQIKKSELASKEFAKGFHGERIGEIILFILFILIILSILYVLWNHASICLDMIQSCT